MATTDDSLELFPPLPIVGNDTDEAWRAYANEYLKAVALLADKTKALYVRHVVHDEPVTSPIKRQRFKNVFDAMTDYYLRASTRERWTETLTFFVGDDSNGVAAVRGPRKLRKTALSVHLFWELMRMRVLARLNDDRRVERRASDFKELIRLRAAVPKRVTIERYTFRELDQALTFLLRRWKTLAYGSDLEEYAGALLDRTAVFFCGPATDVDMDVSEFRQRLIDGGESGRNFTTARSTLYGPNFDCVRRMQLRYGIVERKLRFYAAFEKASDARADARLYPAPAWLRSGFLARWCRIKVKTIHGTFTEDVMLEYRESVVSPGDREWLRYVEPTLAASVSTKTVLDRLHPTVSAALIAESSRSPESVLLGDATSRVRAGMYENVVLRLLDKLFGGEIALLDRWTVRNFELEDKYVILLQAQKPLLVQAFSRYRVFFDGYLHASLDDVADRDVFDVVDLWIRVMLTRFPESRVAKLIVERLRDEMDEDARRSEGIRGRVGRRSAFGATTPRNNGRTSEPCLIFE